MKERPLLFSASMVRATLADIKTHTRRIAKHPAIINLSHVVDCGDGWFGDEEGDIQVRCPYGEVGDQLWVRETHAIVPRTAYVQSEGVDQVNKPDDNHDAAVFKAGWVRSRPSRWRPSIHMPRWASRIQLEITGIRVERLQDISEEDAMAEGCQTDIGEGAGLFWFDGQGKNKTGRAFAYNAREAYSWLWEEINGAGSWDLNPLVWVIEFKRIKP